MKKLITAFLALTLLLTLCACAQRANPQPSAEPTPAPVVEPTAAPTTEPAVEPTVEPTAEPAPLAARTPEMMAAYAAALRGVYENHVYPDGTDCGFDGIGDISDNQFAVLDIDGDGADELILTVTTTYMAGMNESVYAYLAEADKLVRELCVFPSVTYYDNGLVKEDWSHNQGLAPNYWPYTLYSYDAQQDGYAELARVDAWERAVSETDYNGNPYPADIDAANDGVVFLIAEKGGEHMLSLSDYEAWFAEILGGGVQRTISYTALTPENIQALG